MNRRRLTALATGIALSAGAAWGATAAQAEPAQPAGIDVGASSYWACAGLDTVDVATCIEDPVPDLSQLPSVRQVLYDLTGIPVAG